MKTSVFFLTKWLLSFGAAFLIMSGTLYAQVDTLKVKTSAQCSECVERIETALAYEKGIKKSKVIVPGGECIVVYNSAKASPAKIRKAISLVGYDADSVPADPKAYAKLPACCLKPGDPLRKEH